MKLIVTKEAELELSEQIKQYDMTNKALRLYVAGAG